MKKKGFTLIELLIVLFVLAIILAIAFPSFKQTIQDSRTKTAQYELLGAIEYARTLAVFNRSRSILTAKNNWHDGWIIFLDKDDNGVLGNDESILVDHPPLSGVKITGNSSMDKRISFISTGEGRAPGKANAGAFIAGKLIICPRTPGKSYKLVLSRGGRTRTDVADEQDCKE